MGGYADRLKKMTKKMVEQQKDYVPGGAGFTPIPDGEYNFRVRAVIDEWAAKPATDEADAKPARLYVSFNFVVEEGDHTGREVKNNCGLEERVSSHICRGIIEDLGYEWPEDNLAKLEEILDDITARAPLVTATVKTRPQKNNPEFTNTAIKLVEVLEFPNGDEKDESLEEPAEEEVEEETTEEETTEETSEEETNGDKQALLDFAASQGIDGFTDDNELEEMVDALKEAGLDPISGDNLTDEEKELLERLDLADVLIEKVAPKKKAVAIVKKVAAKPVLKKGKK
jgi:hypothetical protein